MSVQFMRPLSELKFWSEQTKVSFRTSISETIANVVAILSYIGDDDNSHQSLIDEITPEEVSAHLEKAANTAKRKDLIRDPDLKSPDPGCIVLSLQCTTNASAAK